MNIVVSLNRLHGSTDTDTGTERMLDPQLPYALIRRSDAF